MLISVIVPVYNVEKQLNRCVDSILVQKVEDMEVLLIDDGSTDRSGEICEEYAAKDSRVKVVHQANAGVSAARNRGLELATGEYIAFCDSDDEFVDDFLEIALKDIVEKNPEIWVGSTIRVEENGKETARSETEERIECPIKNMTELQMISAFNTLACVYAKVWKRSVVSDIRFDTELSFGEDLIFSFQTIQHGFRIVVVPRIVYLYHLMDTGLANRVDEKKCRGIVSTYEFLYEYASSRKWENDGEYCSFVDKRWYDDLTYMYVAILRSPLSLYEQRRLIAILLSDKMLFKKAKAKGFRYEAPWLYHLKAFVRKCLKR